MRVNYAILFVSDMDRSLIFYRDVLGMTLRFHSPQWAEFETEGATLALHLGDAASAADNPGLEPAGRCRPGLQVGDLDAFHARMLAHQVICLQEPTLTFGVRIAQYMDPDRLVFSVSEERR